MPCSRSAAAAARTIAASMSGSSGRPRFMGCSITSLYATLRIDTTGSEKEAHVPPIDRRRQRQPHHLPRRGRRHALHGRHRGPRRRPARAHPPPPDRDADRRLRPPRRDGGRRGTRRRPPRQRRLRSRRPPPLLERRRDRRRAPGHRSPPPGFGNAGETAAAVTGTASPPGNLEWYLTQIYTAGGRPGALDGAFLATRYRTEFTMTAIPTAVRRVLLPALAACARALRRYPHFADAPAPARPTTGATLPGRSTTRARSSAG